MVIVILMKLTYSHWPSEQLTMINIFPTCVPPFKQPIISPTILQEMNLCQHQYIHYSYTCVKVPMQRKIQLCFYDPAWYFSMHWISWCCRIFNYGKGKYCNPRSNIIIFFHFSLFTTLTCDITEAIWPRGEVDKIWVIFTLNIKYFLWS